MSFVIRGTILEVQIDGDFENGICKRIFQRRVGVVAINGNGVVFQKNSFFLLELCWVVLGVCLGVKCL